MVGRERRHADDPGAQDERAAGGGPEPRVPQQLGVEQRLADPALDQHEAANDDQGEHRQDDGGSVDAVAALGERRDGQRHGGDQQDQPGDVDPAAERRPPTRAMPRRLGSTSGQAEDGGHGVGSPPAEPMSRAAASTAPAAMPRPTLAAHTEVAWTRSGPGG